jgi:hypothetical protein
MAEEPLVEPDETAKQPEGTVVTDTADDDSEDEELDPDGTKAVEIMLSVIAPRSEQALAAATRAEALDLMRGLQEKAPE